MKRFFVAGSCLLAVFCLCLMPAFAAMQKAPEGTITLTVPEGAEPTKPSVAFQHKSHEKLECTGCHHKWDGKGEILKCKSSGCHDQYPVKKGENSYYLSYHAKGKQSCYGCHTALKKEKAAAYGPTSCNKCHIKK